MKTAKVSPDALTTGCYGWYGHTEPSEEELNEERVVTALRENMERADRERRIKSHQIRVKKEEVVYVQEEV